MQIPKTTSCIDNKKNHPNFTAIKSVKCSGLYKKYPELGQELVDAFQSSPKVMEFCKKYDVNIVFHAVKKTMDSVESSVHIFYDNIAKNKFIKFFNGSEDNVTIHSWGNEFNLKDSLSKSTSELKSCILPNSKENRMGGMLESHLDIADEKMQEILAKKTAKTLKKRTESINHQNAKSAQETNKKFLDESIKTLIDKSQS